MKEGKLNGRTAAERRGRRAEDMAALYLRLKGYRILDRRARTPRGEVDIVARRGRTLVFVEVKARSSVAALGDAIDEPRFARVVAAGDILAARHARWAENIRFDLILVAPRRWPRHLVNVWHGA